MKLLWWTIIIFMATLIAALLGFGIIVTALAGIAKILFYIFAVIFIILLIMNFFRKNINDRKVG
jgi:uncharacterized membrane protein YtjA (UPF0391 family)